MAILIFFISFTFGVLYGPCGPQMGLFFPIFLAIFIQQFYLSFVVRRDWCNLDNALLHWLNVFLGFFQFFLLSCVLFFKELRDQLLFFFREAKEKDSDEEFEKRRLAKEKQDFEFKLEERRRFYFTFSYFTSESFSGFQNFILNLFYDFIFLFLYICLVLALVQLKFVL